MINNDSISPPGHQPRRPRTRCVQASFWDKGVLLRWGGVGVIALLGMSASLASAESPPLGSTEAILKLTLAEAVQAALDQNPTIRIYRERIEAARSAQRTQLGALLPNLSSVGKMTNQSFYLGTIGGAPQRTQPFDIVDARGSFSQSLFSLSLIERWRASRSVFQATQLESAATENDTVSTVALKYYEGLRQEETLRARLANLKLYEELVDFIRARYAGGMVTGLDVARLESELEHERQRVALTKGDVERAKLDLLNTLGIGESLQVVLNDSLSTFEGPFPDNQQAFELAIRNRPELQMQQQRIKSAELSVKSIKGERLPALSLQGDWGMIGNQSNNTLSTYSVGAVLSVPLWDGGQREGRIGEASSQLTQEQIRLQLVKNQVSLELREALVTLKAALEQYRVAKDGLKASLTQVSLAQQRIRTLSSTTLELSNALSALARARDNMVDALFRVNASRVNLARATGEAKALR